MEKAERKQDHRKVDRQFLVMTHTNYMYSKYHNISPLF